MITTILCIALMFLATFGIHFALRKFNKNPAWWGGSSVIFVGAVLGLLSKDPNYFAIMIGHLAAFEVTKMLGWHK